MAFFMGAMRGWLSELRMRAAKHMGRVGAFFNVKTLNPIPPLSLNPLTTPWRLNLKP